MISKDTPTTTSIPITISTASGSVVTSYEVMWETDDIGGCSGGSDMDSTTITDGYDIMGLEEDSRYTITVTASNSAGSSAVSNTVTAMTLEAGETAIASGHVILKCMAIPPAPFAPPTSVSVSEVTSSSITVQWGQVDCIHRNGDITGYTMRYKVVGVMGTQDMSVSGGSVTEAIISNLAPSTTYNVRVAAMNDAATGVFSDKVIITTLGKVALVIEIHIFHIAYILMSVEAPVLSTGNIAATSISLSWTSAGSEAVSYEVMWETDDIGGCSDGSGMDSATITDGSTSYEIMGLEEDSSYTITVTASNSAGSSAVSNTVTAMTLEAGER